MRIHRRSIELLARQFRRASLKNPSVQGFLTNVDIRSLSVSDWSLSIADRNCLCPPSSRSVESQAIRKALMLWDRVFGYSLIEIHVPVNNRMGYMIVTTKEKARLRQQERELIDLSRKAWRVVEIVGLESIPLPKGKTLGISAQTYDPEWPDNDWAMSWLSVVGSFAQWDGGKVLTRVIESAAFKLFWKSVSDGLAPAGNCFTIRSAINLAEISSQEIDSGEAFVWPICTDIFAASAELLELVGESLRVATRSNAQDAQRNRLFSAEGIKRLGHDLIDVIVLLDAQRGTKPDLRIIREFTKETEAGRPYPDALKLASGVRWARSKGYTTLPTLQDWNAQNAQHTTK